jgi:hypothetical protein
MLGTKTSARNTGPQKTTNSKLTRGLLGSLGLLLLVLVFGASSETNAQTGQGRNDQGKQNDQPQKEQPSAPREAPEPVERGVTVKCEPVTIQDDNGNIIGGGIKCTTTSDKDN